jgi:hypothetical protein
MKRKADIIKPTPAEVPGLVDRAAILEQEIEIRSSELKLIKSRLELYAMDQHAQPLQQEDREGRRVALPGRTHQAKVVFSSDLLISGFRDKSETHQKLLAILEQDAAVDVTAEDLLAKFYSAPSKWETRFDDGHKFRQAAAELLDRHTAPEFIAACRSVSKGGIPKNTTRVVFEEVKP